MGPGGGYPQDQGNGRGGGGGGRIMLALLIAFVGWIMYMYHSEENPVTHEKQHVSISPEEEKKLGLQAAPEMARQMGGELPITDPRAAEVSRMGQYLLTHSIAKNSPWVFKFHLLNDPKTINAFALPGGQIFITLGLLNKLDTEAELAGVLGHEMGHVIERHTAQQMAKSKLGQFFVVAFSTAASVDSRGQQATAIALMVNQMFQLHYSRKDESQADEWGVKIMEQAGFNPQAMIQVLQILKASSGGAGRGPEMLQTHPNPDLRISQIKAYLKEHPPEAGLSQGRNLKDIFNERAYSPLSE